MLGASSGGSMRFRFSLAQGVYSWDDSAVISGFSPIYGAFRGFEGSAAIPERFGRI